MKPLYVGIDVSSKSNVVYLMLPDGSKHSNFSALLNDLGSLPYRRYENSPHALKTGDCGFSGAVQRLKSRSPTESPSVNAGTSCAPAFFML